MATEAVIAGSLMVARSRVHFSQLRDTRKRQGKRHKLVDVILIALLGMLCGCDDADEIADWAEARVDLLSDWFALVHGVPSQDTILRVFALVKPKALERAVVSWLGSLTPANGKRQIAIDGKSLCGSLRRGSGETAVHIVSAWLSDTGLTLGQEKTQDKSNEMKAIPELLQHLDVSGALVSVDAGGCYKDIADAVVSGGGDYLLALKENQPTLRGDTERLFAESLDPRRRSLDELPRPDSGASEHVDAGHGRIEERTAYLCRDLQYLTTACDWPGLGAVGMIVSQTTDKRTGAVSTETRYYITSSATMTAEEFQEAARRHWSIESMHWVLDVVFREDASRIYNRRAAENFSMLRKMALSLLKAAPLPKKKKRMSYKNQRRWCDWDSDYLLQVLLGQGVAVDEATARP